MSWRLLKKALFWDCCWTCLNVCIMEVLLDLICKASLKSERTGSSSLVRIYWIFSIRVVR